MLLKKIEFLALNFLLLTNIILTSVLSNTLIKTSYGYISAKNITIGDTIITYDQEKLSTAKITHLSTTTTDTLIAITTHQGTFYACPTQQFFDPLLHHWITANDITPTNSFLNAQLIICPCLRTERIIVAPTQIYNITTTNPHNFFVTDQELLTHNTFPVIIGFAWLFGEGLKFAGLTIGTTLLGSYVGVQLYNTHKRKHKNPIVNISLEVVPRGQAPDPNDDENNERQINTITKSEFFKTVKNDYEHWRNNIYKRKHKAKGIEDAEYLEWDYTHNDVEAYNNTKNHIGSINPRTLKLYKPSVYNRKFSGR